MSAPVTNAPEEDVIDDDEVDSFSVPDKIFDDERKEVDPDDIVISIDDSEIYK